MLGEFGSVFFNTVPLLIYIGVGVLSVITAWIKLIELYDDYSYITRKHWITEYLAKAFVLVDMAIVLGLFIAGFVLFGANNGNCDG